MKSSVQNSLSITLINEHLMKAQCLKLDSNNKDDDNNIYVNNII